MPEKLLELIISVYQYARTGNTPRSIEHELEFRCYYAQDDEGQMYMLGPVYSWEPEFADINNCPCGRMLCTENDHLFWPKEIA